MGTTYFTHAVGRLQAISEAFSIDPARQEISGRILRTCMESWNFTPVGATPKVLSDITDDHTPFEFSLSFRPNLVDVRFLVEAQPEAPTIGSRWKAGIELLESLERDFGCDISLFRELEDLFEP